MNFRLFEEQIPRWEKRGWKTGCSGRMVVCCFHKLYLLIYVIYQAAYIEDMIAIFSFHIDYNEKCTKLKFCSLKAPACQPAMR